MAGLCCHGRPSPVLLLPRRINGFRCSSSAPNYKKKEKLAPVLLRVAVTGVTELLRLFSTRTKDRWDTVICDELLVSGIDDVLMILKSDYEKSYFVTGMFTSAIYTEDCTFEDPTIKFRGKELYSRNLKLLVPFFDNPSVELQTIEKGISSEAVFILASWKLRTYLKLPWRPLISVGGSTVYDLNNEFRIVRHAENWSISALDAIGQIFTPSFGSPGG